MILFLITFFFIFALICAKNIRYGIYAVIFLMPLYLIRFSIFGIPTTVLEIMIYILFLTLVLNSILLRRSSLLRDSGEFRVCSCREQACLFSTERLQRGVNYFKKNNSILLIGIILLFLGLILSILHSSDLRTSLGICKGWFFDPFLFFIVFMSVIKKTEHIKLSLASWVLSGIAVSLISIIYLLNNELTFDGRLRAFYISPNYLAMYLAPVFLIVLFFLLRDLHAWSVKRSGAEFDLKKHLILFSGRTPLSLRSTLQSVKLKHIKYQALNVVVLIIILIPLFFTHSYGAFLGIFAVVIWLFYRKYKVYISKQYLSFPQSHLSFPRRRESTATINDRLRGGRKIKKQSSKILVLIILIAFVSITAIKFNQVANSENRSSLHSRLMIWNASMEIIKDNPIFGIGPGTFQEVYLSYSEKFDEPYLEWAVAQPHNTFLAFYLQTGLIGLIGFVLILFWFFRLGLKRKNNNIQYSIFNILISLMIYILVHGLVDTIYWKNDLSLMFWLVVGLLLTSSQIYDTILSQDEKGKEH